MVVDNAAEARAAVRIGVFTDVHHAEKPPYKDRVYTDSLTKLQAAVAWFNRQGIDYVVCNGDLIDSPDDGDADLERRFLAETLAVLSLLAVPCRFVLGNHDMFRLTKAEFLARVRQDAGYSAAEVGGIHLVFLDACYTRDGAAYNAGDFDWQDSHLPEAECAWLASDLAATDKPIVVFVHQRLDTPVDTRHIIGNAASVRAILESLQKVMAVVQGHSHYREQAEIGGIAYITLRGMVIGAGSENNAAYILTVTANGVTVQGIDE